MREEEGGVGGGAENSKRKRNRKRKRQRKRKKARALLRERACGWEKDLICEQGPCLPQPCVPCLAYPLWLSSFSPYPMILTAKQSERDETNKRQ